ncbi:uncharacterized protein LOC131213272 [Anopheles bellator]|uniref:uncharacterized protein LOC131213272 n=1 Tax=Anopheles bellator TaxID=139047 RepID=UPI002647A07D|nr:uncharacterized protein LOC131213272 [Anopheles bellator]
MNHLTGLIVLAAALCAGVFGDEPGSAGYYSYKSFGDAEGECAQYLQVPDDRLQRYQREGYPDEPEVRCLVLCVLENLRAWTNTSGLNEQVLQAYFVPSAEDCDNAKRTEKCLFYLPKECDGDRCLQAYRAFQCYYQNYGTLTYCPQFNIDYFDEEVQEALDLFDMLDVSEETRRKLAGGCFPNCYESECFFRAFLLRADLYDDDNGPNLFNLYMQFPEDAFKSDNSVTLACLENLKKLGCNKSKCKQATEVWTQCFANTKSYAEFVRVFKYAAQNY